MNIHNVKKAGKTASKDWVNAAREALIENGIGGVGLRSLAKTLGVTSGNFYWHYKNQQSLYDALLREWIASNVVPFFSLHDSAIEEPREQYLALAYAWILSPEFDPEFDVAIREWSRTEPKVKRLLRAIDHKRMRLYYDIFLKFGHDPHSATVRSRTMYWHQIGYYSMKIEEPIQDRLMLVPYYAFMFTGDSWLSNCVTADEVERALIAFQRHC